MCLVLLKCMNLRVTQSFPHTFLPWSLQNILASKPGGDAKLQELRKQAGTLYGNEEPEESVRRQEVQQSLREVETQWAGVLRGAGEAERSALSEDFHLQKNRTLAWVAERQRALDALGRHAPAEQRRRAAEVRGTLKVYDNFIDNFKIWARHTEESKLR